MTVLKKTLKKVGPSPSPSSADDAGASESDTPREAPTLSPLEAWEAMTTAQQAEVLADKVPKVEVEEWNSAPWLQEILKEKRGVRPGGGPRPDPFSNPAPGTVRRASLLPGRGSLPPGRE